MEGLNIFGNRSLYKLLSYTRTSGGDRLLKTWDGFNSQDFSDRNSDCIKFDRIC